MITSLAKKYVWVINLLILAAISYTLAMIVNDKVKDSVSSPPEAVASLSPALERGRIIKAPGTGSRNSYTVILSRNIFGLSNASLGRATLNPEEARPSTLSLELLATVVKPGDDIAILKNTDTSKVRGYIEGDIIDVIESENVRVSRVGNCIVVVERGEVEKIKCKSMEEEPAPVTAKVDKRQERIKQITQGLDSMEDKTTARNPDKEKVDEGIEELDDGEYVIDRAVLEELLDDPDTLVTDVRIVPQDDGLRFFAIRPNSVFFKIGIRNGDTLHRINDVELSNVKRALSLFEELRTQSEFKIDLSRRGQSLTYEYTVK